MFFIQNTTKMSPTFVRLIRPEKKSWKQMGGHDAVYCYIHWEPVITQQAMTVNGGARYILLLYWARHHAASDDEPGVRYEHPSRLEGPTWKPLYLRYIVLYAPTYLYTFCDGASYEKLAQTSGEKLTIDPTEVNTFRHLHTWTIQVWKVTDIHRKDHRDMCFFGPRQADFASHKEDQFWF